MQEYIDFIGRNPMLSAAWFGLFVAIIYTSIRSLLSPVKVIGNRETTLLINRESGVVVDVRTPDEFSKGHIVDAVNIPASQITANNLSQIEKLRPFADDEKARLKSTKTPPLLWCVKAACGHPLRLAP